MKKLLLAFASLFLLAGCASEDEPIVIETDVPGVSLEIPKSALPKDLDVDDIMVSDLPTEELPELLTSGDFRGYKLEPDGIQFSEPIHVVIPVDEGIGFFLHVTKEKVELVNNVEYVFADEGNIARVPIEHFSSLIEYRGHDKPFGVEGDTLDSVAGEPLGGSVTVTLENPEYRDYYKGKPLMSYSIEEDTQTISNYFTGDNVTPGFMDNAPPLTSFGESYLIRPSLLKCIRPGPAALSYNIFLQWKVFNAGFRGPLDNLLVGSTPEYVSVKVHTEFECLTPEKEPRCGDNEIDPGESCDGRELGGKTCFDFGYKARDFLRCDRKCEFNTYNCKIVHELSCNENTWNDETELWDNWVCFDDCPEGQTCSGSCECISETDSQVGGAFQKVSPGGITIEPDGTTTFEGFEVDDLQIRVEMGF